MAFINIFNSKYFRTMEIETLTHLKSWFDTYVAHYYTGVAEHDRNIRLKEDHTHRVRHNMMLLCDSLNMSPQDSLLAEAVSLFHDIGRFEQYLKYHTFNDITSVNHAHLGLRVLAAHRVLSEIPVAERRLLTVAIAFHNAATLPGDMPEHALRFMKLIRDADKLDIWKVVTDYYQEREDNPNSTIELGLPDASECSAAAIEALHQEKFARVQDMKTLNDFKLLQISWVFDLNFEKSFQLLKERRYIEQIAETLPRLPEIRSAVDCAYRRVQRHCAESLPI